jgi:transcriptional/translational regulatory protein YebC/TACO1
MKICVDEKVEIWKRVEFDIDDITEEKIKEIAKECKTVYDFEDCLTSEDISYEISEYEYLPETELEYEGDNLPTFEVYKWGEWTDTLMYSNK